MRTPSPNATCATPARRFACTLALAVLLCISTAGPAFAQSSAPDALRPAPVVVVLLSPYLEFADLTPSATPSLWSLAEKGAIGSMNAVTGDPRWPTVAGGALTISASRWASASTTAPADARSLPEQQAANSRSLSHPELGALGSALRGAGSVTAAVGSSDPGTGTAIVPLRPAELVATDAEGRITFSATGDELLMAEPTAPFGVWTDRPRLYSAIASAFAAVEAHPNPGGLLVVDTGDLARVHEAAQQPGADATLAADDHRQALSTLDAVAGELARQMPEDSLLLVVTATTAKPYYEPPYFGPVIASGRGLVGVLGSASTHRPGLITNLDIAPTALAAVGVEAPSTMLGRPVFARPDDAPLAEKIAALSQMDRTAGAVDKLRDLYFTPAFAWFAVICTLLALLASFRRTRWLEAGSSALLVLVLSAPPAAWVALLLARTPGSPASAAVAFGIAWLVTFAAALAVQRLVGTRAALACLAADTALLVMVDQWFGGPLSSGLFSYSIRAGWRYYGIGNEGSALAVAGAIAAVGLATDLAAGSRWEGLLRRFGIPVVGAVVLVTAAAPFAGANAGVAIWGVVGFAVAWLRINRVRFTVRSVLLTTGAVVAFVAVVALLDRFAGGGGTHIGRFFAGFSGGGSAVWEMVSRKALNNLGYVTQTPYSWLALAIAAALAIEWWVRPRPLAVGLNGSPAYAGALLGVLAGAVVALLTEDSGVVMPALMLLAGALPALALSLTPPAREDGPAQG